MTGPAGPHRLGRDQFGQSHVAVFGGQVAGNQVQNAVNVFASKHTPAEITGSRLDTVFQELD